MSGFRNHLLILLLFLPGLSGSQNNDSIEMLNKLCWETVFQILIQHLSLAGAWG
jgi:hypothetical protein